MKKKITIVPVEQALDILRHASYCEIKCEVQHCRRMKSLIWHLMECKKKEKGDCHFCREMIALIVRHSKFCQIRTNCNVLYCNKLKETLKKSKAGSSSSSSASTSAKYKPSTSKAVNISRPMKGLTSFVKSHLNSKPQSNCSSLNSSGSSSYNNNNTDQSIGQFSNSSSPANDQISTRSSDNYIPLSGSKIKPAKLNKKNNFTPIPQPSTSTSMSNSQMSPQSSSDLSSISSDDNISLSPVERRKMNYAPVNTIIPDERQRQEFYEYCTNLPNNLMQAYGELPLHNNHGFLIYRDSDLFTFDSYNY